MFEVLCVGTTLTILFVTIYLVTASIYYIFKSGLTI